MIECFTCLKHSPRSPGKAGHGLHRSFCEPACVSTFEHIFDEDVSSVDFISKEDKLLVKILL